MWACIQIRRYWNHIAAYCTAVTHSYSHRPTLLYVVQFYYVSSVSLYSAFQWAWLGLPDFPERNTGDFGPSVCTSQVPPIVSI